jgi:hypothetical protein
MNASTGQPSLRAYRPRQFPDLTRLGRDHDGGYVLPRRIVTASRALLSLGVAADWTFEEAALGLVPGLAITCVDGTTGPAVIRARVRSELWRVLSRLRIGRALQIARDLGKPRAFEQFFAVHRFVPALVAPAAGPGLATLADLLGEVRAATPDGRVLVKMDIEGAEYDVLAASRGLWTHVAGLIIEFHALDRHWADFEREMAALAQDFVIAHVHGNNNDGCIPGSRVPLTLELTLVHRMLVESDLPPAPGPFPLAGLDQPCKPRHPDLPLDFG